MVLVYCIWCIILFRIGCKSCFYARLGWILLNLHSFGQQESPAFEHFQTVNQLIRIFEKLRFSHDNKHTPDDVDIDFPRCFTALSLSHLSPPARGSLRLRYRHSSTQCETNSKYFGYYDAVARRPCSHDSLESGELIHISPLDSHDRGIHRV